MAETSLTYLNFRTIKDISPALLPLPPSAHFLKYSTLYWGIHARRKSLDEVVSLALKLFSQIESHISTKLLLVDLISRTGRCSRDIPINGPLEGFTGLHCASILGTVEIATALMDQPNYDVNKRDFLGITPLIWAAICGQGEVAKLLLERRTLIPGKSDRWFRRTVLSWAAGKGDEGVVEALLGRTSAKRDGWWGKALPVIDVVRGRRYVNPNKPDKYGQTPILLAAEDGHQGVAKLLLGMRDVNPDAADGYGSTPLLLASGKGREEVVKLLLEQGDVIVDNPDKSGQTPLLAAAEGGSARVVALLLSRKDINPNERCKAGRTPLWLASRNGHEGVVRLLLEREDFIPYMPDNRGQTPLSLAAENGHARVLELLLNRDDVNPNKPDKDGRTPLSLSSKNRNKPAVELLQARKRASPNPT